MTAAVAETGSAGATSSSAVEAWAGIVVFPAKAKAVDAGWGLPAGAAGAGLAATRASCARRCCRRAAFAAATWAALVVGSAVPGAGWDGCAGCNCCDSTTGCSAAAAAADTCAGPAGLAGGAAGLGDMAAASLMASWCVMEAWVPPRVDTSRFLTWKAGLRATAFGWAMLVGAAVAGVGTAVLGAWGAGTVGVLAAGVGTATGGLGVTAGVFAGIEVCGLVTFTLGVLITAVLVGPIELDRVAVAEVGAGVDGAGLGVG